MKKKFVFLLLLTSLHVFPQLDDDNTISNEFIVMMKPQRNIDELLKIFPSLQTERCLSKRMNIWLLKRNTIAGAEDFLLSLKKNEIIKLAQFNHKVQQRGLIPNDASFVSQWNMLNTGQTGVIRGADIDATDAWAINHSNLTVNGDTIVVAIVDNTFDFTHQDLNFFVNHHEIPNNGIDDDGNGYVDDYFGWDAVYNNGDINTPVADPHSMHCSGIAGAIGNNGIGVAGVCWGVQLMRIEGSSETEAVVVAAYDYVLTMRRMYDSTSGAKGAFIVSTSNSFGVGTDGANPADYPIWCAMYDTMGFYGILSAAAAPDAGVDVDMVNDVPTGCPSKWLITVTNTDNTDHLYGYPNPPDAAWGDTTINMSAPGASIYSTEGNNSYGYMSGTSMSTPHVAGAVAAMFAAACPAIIQDYFLHPDSIALLVKQMIMDGTTRVSDLYNLTISGGRLNLYHAVRNLEEYNCNRCSYSLSPTTTQPTCSNTCNGSAGVTPTGAGVYRYNWSTGDSGVSILSNLCQGFYSVTVTDSATGCQQIKNFSIYKPDSILITSIHTIPASGGDSGNIIVTAHAGNYVLGYSLDGVNYQQASTLVVSANGSYNVYIKNNIGCVVERTVVLSGIAEILKAESFNIYPNPANDRLNISVDLSATQTIQFSILDVLGERIFEEQKKMPSGLNAIATDISFLANGIYFLNITDGTSSVTKKFVVAR